MNDKKSNFFFITTLFIFIISWQNILAQNQVRIDSLLNQLSQTQGDKKVDVWNALSWEYHKFNPEKSIDYGEKALALAQKQNYQLGIAQSLRNIGLAHRSNLNITGARKYFYFALPVYEQIEDSLGWAQCMNDLGEAYKYRGDYKQALDKYKKAVAAFEALGAKEGTANVLSNIADTYYKLAKYKNALKFALKSLAIARETGTNQGIKDASLILSEAYANIGNFQEAYNFHLMHTNIKDSVFRVEKTKEIQLLEEKFATEKREAEAQMQQERAAELAKMQKERRDNIQYSLIFLLFIALFGSMTFIGKFDIPTRYVESLIFLTLLLAFRFILIILTSITYNYSEGGPIFILGANVILAILFMPLHKLIEKRLKKKVIEEHIDDHKLKIVPNKFKGGLFRNKKEKQAKDVKKYPKSKKEQVLGS